MAHEPYRPLDEDLYRDELDREIDQKIDTFFHRWNWKLARFIRRAAIVLFGLWVLWNVIPGLFAFLASADLGPMILQTLGMAGYLFVFIGFQFSLMYFFMARTRIYWVKPGETGVGFKDYKGNPEVLEAASRIVTLLQGVKGFKDMGGEITRGVLLIGPPGTGKSYLAQAISTEASVPFGYLSAPSLTSAWMGMGNIKVMNLYRKARKLAREYGACILFIDEIDAIGMARNSRMMGGYGLVADSQETAPSKVMMGGGMGMGAGSGLLNELLLQMDPPPQETNLLGKMLRWLNLRGRHVEMPAVLTIGATNLGEELDRALLRPGRFDRKIVIDAPDADGRQEIIEYYLSKVKSEPMPLDRMVRDTIGFTPVAIKYVINEAVIRAHFDGRQEITYWDFTQAREVHEWGLRQPIRSMSFKDRRRLAYHEAGHAYAMVKLYQNKRLIKVTIVRHGGALGLAAPKPIEPSYTSIKEEELEDIQVSLASRAAEEVFLGVQMTGVTNDLIQATLRAARLIGAYGMDNSFVSYDLLDIYGEHGTMYRTMLTNGELKGRIDAILDEQYSKVKRLIERNKVAVTALAEALILRNELTDIDVTSILTRIEVQHPFVDPGVSEDSGFGFRVNNRFHFKPAGRSRRNGHYGSNGKASKKDATAVTTGAEQAPVATPSWPAENLNPLRRLEIED